MSYVFSYVASLWGARVLRPPLPHKRGKTKQTVGNGSCPSLRNSSVWHMTLTDRCWKTDFPLYPKDICLSPRVCSCMDQIVEDVCQMLTTYQLPNSASDFLWLPIKNKSHTFSIRIHHYRTLRSWSLCQKQTYASVLHFSVLKITAWHSNLSDDRASIHIHKILYKFPTYRLQNGC